MGRAFDFDQHFAAQQIEGFLLTGTRIERCG
jgi:hypothetical protein